MNQLRKISALLFAAILFFASAVMAASPPRERISFDANWRFVKGDPSDAKDQLDYQHTKDWILLTARPFEKNASTNFVTPNTPKPGEQISYVQPDFDDSHWRELNLPQDWAIKGPFEQSLPGETAKLPFAGAGWYRKHFTLPASDSGRRIFLDVDGAMSFATVWLNGHFIGGWPYGYTSWRLDLTPFLKFGGANVLVIRLDNPPESSRWYPGAGIYRNVWLVKTDPLHIGHWGTQITYATNVVHMETTVENLSAQADKGILETTILDPKGKAVGRASRNFAVTPDNSQIVKMDFAIAQPEWWSPDSPELYTATSKIFVNDHERDETKTVFGLRTFAFTATNGFLLNGKRVQIKGVCLHQDFGALGTALNLSAMKRELELVRETGCNAIRIAHNPASPEMLALCDRMGFLVMEEAFDAWDMAKRTNDYHILFDDWSEPDLCAMIRRDRNHPGIILWSLGNEVYEQHEGTNAWMAGRLAAIAHDEDATRPVCMALHVVAASTNGFQNQLDVFGYNYTPGSYAEFRTNNPDLPLVASETTSTVSSRGEYFFPVSENPKEGRANFQVSSYDYAAPSWACSPDVEFKALDENPFVAGQFIWTGFDYLGEPTPYDSDTSHRLLFTDAKTQAKMDAAIAAGEKIKVPSRSSYFGIFDLCGFRKDRFYLYQARWRPDFPMAHIVPQNWNWPERIGKVTPVHIYTSGDEAELFLNGKSLGRKKRGPFDYRLRWENVIYEPGTLKVVAYKNGKKWATDVVKTSGPAAQIKLAANQKTIRADGKDLAFITVTLTDKNGLFVPDASNRVRFTLDGPGDIVATDNGDATSHEPFQQNDRAAFNGMCLAIVRADAGVPGKLILHAGGDGLKSAGIVIRSR